MTLRPPSSHRAIEAAMPKLRRSKLLRRFAQRKARHMRGFCAVSAIHCLSCWRLHSDISACSASQLATRSGLVAKRGSLPQSGEPIAASHAAHCRSSRGEIAA